MVAIGDGRFIGVDLRTGKQLRHVDIQHAKGYRTTALAGGQALTEAPGAVRAFAERDGRSPWTAKTPKSCPDGLVITAYALPGHLSVVPLVCNVTSPNRGMYNLLLGIDNRTGKVLWQQHTAAPRLMVRGGEHTLVIPDPDHPPTIQLLDVNRQGALRALSLPRMRGMRSPREAASYCRPSTPVTDPRRTVGPGMQGARPGSLGLSGRS
ncbi:hypothetical protein ACFYPZ_10895 [Streptomyces sp. NPDC005506]|uniref:hypothetical protein n=1 Tax=Streptomyces sp. NPDC005506 TaxID=3364718 RepID=UPI00369B03C3